MATSHYSADSARDPLLLLSVTGCMWLPSDACAEKFRRSTFPRAGSSELCIAASGIIITKLG